MKRSGFVTGASAVSPFSLSMKVFQKRWVILLLLVLAGAAAWFLTRPYLFGQTKTGWVFVRPVHPGSTITLKYRHSVERTIVEEDLVVNEAADGLLLKSTRYQTYGWGLPFLASEGKFRRDGDWFVLDDVNRPFPTLSIRSGVVNNETVSIDGKDYFLPDLMPLGSEFHMYVCPLYKGYWMKKEIH